MVRILRISGSDGQCTWSKLQCNLAILRQFLPLAHSGHRVLSCPAPSVHLSLRPSRITTLRPTIFNGSCSYLIQPLSFLGAWALLFMGFLCLFSRIQWHFEILWIHWLTYFLDEAGHGFQSSGRYFYAFHGTHTWQMRCSVVLGQDGFQMDIKNCSKTLEPIWNCNSSVDGLVQERCNSSALAME